MLRKAQQKDISRIAEILIFTKRQTYRPIFRNDNVSFNEMQVLNEIERLRKPHEMDDLYVFEDENDSDIVKAVLTVKPEQNRIWITDFYVDVFFQGQGIGTKILNTIFENEKGKEIHVNPLDQNKKTIEYYEKMGFKYTGNKKEFANSGFYMLDYYLEVK